MSISSILIQNWLHDISEYIKINSYGLATIRVIDFNGITFGIIDPYGYYIMNYKSEIYLLRDHNIAFRFSAKKEEVILTIENTGLLSFNYIDTLFANPPISASKLKKFILFRDANPRKYTAIALINKCIDLQILEI